MLARNASAQAAPSGPVQVPDRAHTFANVRVAADGGEREAGGNRMLPIEPQILGGTGSRRYRGDVLERADQVAHSAREEVAGLDNDDQCRGCQSDQAIPAPTPAAPPTPTPAPAAPKVACAQPVNWNHFGATDHGPDAIRVSITWGSSTGRLADLSNCTVREVVSYDPIPNPPFLLSPPNPTILTVPGVNGAGMDTHSYGPGLKTGIANPRVAGTMTSHQTYQFRCTGPGCSGSWTTFPGQTYDIVRQVYPQFARTNPWRYVITKTGTGAGNSFSYSREVAVPEP